MTKNKPLLKFDFWLENKKDQHYELNEVDLIERFIKWLSTKDKDWINYYNSSRAIASFIGDKEGLNSVSEDGQFAGIYEILRPIYIDAHK